MKLFSKSLSLGVKFVVSVVIILAIIFSISGYISYNSDVKRHTFHFNEKAKLLADVVSLVTPEAIFAFDFFSLNEHIKKISLRHDVVYCAIKDHEGKYVTSFLNRDDPIISQAIKNVSSECEKKKS